MRLLLSTIGSRGDVQPVVALAAPEALRHALQPDVAVRARQIAAAVRTDGAKVAAQRLISVISGSAI